MTYPEALKAVAKRYGIEVREKEMTPEEVARNDNRESMFVVNSWAAEYFSNYLLHETEGMSVGMTYFRQKRDFPMRRSRSSGSDSVPPGAIE